MKVTFLGHAVKESHGLKIGHFFVKNSEKLGAYPKDHGQLYVPGENA